MTKNCNTSPFYLQGQSPTIQNQVAIIERFLKKQLPNYAVITISLNGVDIPKDEFGNVNLEIERINYAAGDGISIDDNVISCTITDTTYTAGENISIDENNVISTTVIDDSTQSNKSTWSSNKINSFIQEFNNFTITVVNQLPVSGEPYVLYLVGNGSGEQSNVKDEYLWIVENNVGRWEKIGTTQITILQSDWHQSDTTAQDYIKNKPTDLVHTSDIEGLLRNDGSVYTGKYLEQVQDLDNFQASEGKIVQYIGETNSKYTNGYVYKRVGKQTVIPVGTDYYTVNESTGELAKVGIPNCNYYKIEDSNDPVASNIRWHTILIGTQSEELGAVPVRNVTTSGYTDVVVDIGCYGLYNNKFLRVKEVGNLNERGGIRWGNTQITSNSYVVFEDDSTVYVINHGEGDDALISSNLINIYENEDGIRIYQREYYNQTLFPLELNNGIYQVIGRWNGNFMPHSTSEQVIIDTTEWQQWDVQPREDTSHYVTDSEIGWIEH